MVDLVIFLASFLVDAFFLITFFVFLTSFLLAFLLALERDRTVFLVAIVIMID